jgi:uncharacterized protein (TIGR02646 family)
MRAIKKQMQTLTRLQKKGVPEDTHQATNAWRNFDEKDYVQARLLEEQYYLCCYSEIRADLVGIGWHIEHVQPKSKFPQHTFDYANLAACAIHSKQLQHILTKERFGGHFKQDRYHQRAFISCHQTDCARFFAYLSDGSIVPHSSLNLRERRRAKYTIALLNLNSEYLRQQRQAWWDEIDALWQEHQANAYSVADLAAVDLLPGRQGAGKLSPFFSLTRQFFDGIAEQVLQQAGFE